VLRTTEDGRLGLATIHESKLYMLSRKDGAEADVVWTHDRVIELETLLSSNAILTEPVLVGFVDRNGVILLRTDNALFTVHLKTSKVKKVCDGARSICSVVVPYMSFYTPGTIFLVLFSFPIIFRMSNILVTNMKSTGSRMTSLCKKNVTQFDIIMLILPKSFFMTI
jgi:hypothetical protein